MRPNRFLCFARRSADDRGADTDTDVENEYAPADSHRIDLPGSGRSRNEPDRVVNLGGNTELARDQIPRPRGDDAERDRAADETVDDVGDRSVPSRGHDQIEAIPQARPDDLAGFVRLEGLVDLVVVWDARK